MNPELEKYVNAAHSVHYLYTEADGIVSNCVSRWNEVVRSETPNASFAVPELPKASFRVMISSIGEGMRNLMYTDPGQFWNGGQRDLCLKLLKPLHRETQKLKRKLERITGMISEQMKILTPLLISYSDESFFLSAICNTSDLNHLTTAKQSAEMEREVLKIMASGIMNGVTAKKMGFVNRMKAAVFCGSMSSRKAKVLKSFQARLHQIEEEEKSLQDSNKAFDSIEDFSAEAEKFMVVWGNGDNGEQSVKSNPDEELIAEIVSEASAKYFPTSSATETENDQNEEEDVLNKNLNGNEITILHHPPASLSPCSSDLDAQKENMDLAMLSLQYPEDPFTNFKTLVKEARDMVGRITASVRDAEKNFYAPPGSLADGSTTSLELKDFIYIVEEAGIGLQVKIARNERKGKSSFTVEQLDFMKSLGKVYRVGASLLAQLESLTGMVQTGAGDLKGLISEYQGGQISEDEVDVDLPVADVKRCPQLEMLFSASQP